MGRKKMTDQQAEEKIKEIVEAVLRKLYPQGGYVIGNCNYDGRKKTYYIHFSKPESDKVSSVEISYDHLRDNSDIELKRMALGQIESS